MNSISMKIDDKFRNLKSDYFLKKLFSNLKRKKQLDIIKYNKNMKKRININIKDYKEYSEKYSSIEIEIIPKLNKSGYFINIFHQEDKKYFHIYFNGNKEEIKRNYLIENDKVKKIKIIIEHQVKEFDRLFLFCRCIEIITFKKFSRNNIFNMAYMFRDCSSLKELNFRAFNTDNVMNMHAMFAGCSSLKQLNLNNFNINNEVKMSCMFLGCSDALKEKIKEKYKNIKEEAF